VLFPASPVRAFSARRLLLCVVAAGAGTAAALLRVAHALDTTWAEDAHIFLADALAHPIWTNLATPYSGYLHTLPRLLAELAAFAPPAYAPAALTVAAALCTVLLSLVVYVASAGHLQSTPARLAVSVPMLLLPFAQAELPLSLATLRWQLMYVTFWALLWTPATRTGRVILVLLVALSVSSDNVVILFLPLALARWYVRRDRLSAALAAIVGLGAAVSVAIPAFGIDMHPTIHPRVSPLWAVEAYVVRPLPQLLFGGGSIGDRPGRGVAGLAITAAAWGCVAMAVLVAWRRRTPRWPLATLAAAYSGGMYVFVVMTSGYALSRYSAPVALLIVTALVALLAPHPDARRVGPARWLPFGVLATGLLVVCALNFRIPNVRSDGPLWSKGLTSARVVCASGVRQADIPVSPTALGWDAKLPCDYLRR
jgi:hypothetical protein